MAFHRTLRRGLARLGIHAYARGAVWSQAEDFRRVAAAVAADGVRGNSDDRCYTLYRIAQALGAVPGAVPGDVFECGCRFGKSTRFILAGLGADSDKTVHVFDSFEGLSAPGPEDAVAGRGGAFWSAGDLRAGEEAFLHNLRADRHRVRSYRGWIPERFGELGERRFCLAHIDVDLYAPTRAALEFVYDRVPPRGVILCDDYGSTSCPGARRAFDEFFAERPENIVEMTNIQALVVKAGL